MVNHFLAWLVMGFQSLAYATLSGALLVVGVALLLWWRGFAWLPLIGWSFTAAAVVVVIVLLVACMLVPTQPTARQLGEGVRVAHLNVLFYSNFAFAEKLAFVQQSGADVVSLVEVPEKLGELMIEQSGYPYHFQTSAPSTGRNLPMLTLSRWPLKVAHQWSPRAMAFTVQHPQTPFTFIQLHPQSPYTPNAFAKRNVELAALTSPTFPAPVVAVGDLNTTPWDNALHPLRQNLTFRGPWLPTFPSFMPLAPIDLVLSSPHWPTQNIQRVHVPGTDHLAIVANFPTPPKQP